MRDRYIQSLRSYRKYQPSNSEMEATALFFHIEGPMSKKAVYAMLKSSAPDLSASSMKRIYDKVKYASNEYLK